MNITYIKNNIYVSDQAGATDLMCMIKNGVAEQNLPTRGWAVLNVAWDLDINYRDNCYKTSPAGDEYNDLLAEHHKVGLVDGPGNLPLSLAAAVLMVRQLDQRREYLCAKDVPSDKNMNAYPAISQILIHCHSGHSRSVVVAGTYLYKANPDDWKTVEEAIEFVAKQRDAYKNQPQRQCLVQLAQYHGTQDLINAGWDMPYQKDTNNCC